MGLKLDMNKSAQALQFSLEKKGVNVGNLRAEVAIDFDVSGSYEGEHRGGQTQQLLTRLVPWGLVFDPDKQLDVFTFSDGPGHVHHVGMVTPANCDGFIKREIIDIVPGWNGGTDYSHVLEANLKTFGWIGGGEQQVAKQGGGFLGRVFGQKPAPQVVVPVARRRSLVLFNTDGGNSDRDRTMRILEESEKRKDEIYFLFIAYADPRRRPDFSFLNEIGDRFGNTGTVVITDLEKFTNLPDEQLNEQLLGDELVGWLKAS